MCLRAQCERAVVGGHDEIGACCLFPEHSRGEVNCVERSELSRHGLGGAVEDNRIDLDEFEGGDECQDDRASRPRGRKDSPAAAGDPMCGGSRS